MMPWHNTTFKDNHYLQPKVSSSLAAQSYPNGFASHYIFEHPFQEENSSEVIFLYAPVFPSERPVDKELQINFK